MSDIFFYKIFKFLLFLLPISRLAKSFFHNLNHFIMANIFNAFIYGINAAGGTTEIAAAGGQSNGFPSANCHFYPTTEVRGNAQVTCAAIIELLPSGLNQPSTKFYTASTVAQLITAANA